MENKKLILSGKAFSKINIGLDIFKASYSYTTKHKIKSLFYLYKKLYDEIFLYEWNNSYDEIIYNNYEINKNKCLVQKTLNYLRRKKIINGYYYIIINKNIPIQSGLGGGSSDAAFIINALCKNSSILNLKEIALQLGSDIPFFIKKYDSAIVSEFGEEVTKVDLKTDLKIGIFLTNLKFSTKEIFDKYLSKNRIDKVNNYQNIIYNLNNNNISNIDAENNLFLDVYEKSLEWKKNYDFLKTEHDFIIMSGSGGTIVTIDKNIKIRTRYAPSPTGYFHIGGARTAIFNYLYAKHNDGDFIVRIEDTDTSRSVENGIESQLNNLDWLGIKIDESIRNPGEYGPYIQTSKIDIYKKYADSLVNENKAYFCFCSEEKLEEERQENLKNHKTPKYSRHCLYLSESEKQDLINKKVPYVVRLKIDENKTYEWDDLIRGKISVPGDAMTDPVILKSNGIAMYNFAVVIDDYEMKITHVLRGEEHISNTPYQIAIGNSLEFNNDIKFGHLSIIIDESGKKLSKRNKEMKQFVEDYKNMGFLPESVFNFLALLSWSHPENKEILNQDELIKSFDINSLSKSPTFFDYKKLLWIGNEYFKKIDNDKYINFVKPFINFELNEFLIKNFSELVLLFKNQISYASELNNLFDEYFDDNKNVFFSNEMNKIIEKNQDVIKSFYIKIQQLTNWTIDSISNVINEVKIETNKKGKDLFMPIRIASTGKMHGPELAKIIFLKQQNIILSNIDKINLK